MSVTTWELVCEKREWRKALKDYIMLQNRAAMEQIFMVWKQGSSTLEDEFSRLRRHHDNLIAGALWLFKRLSRSVTQAMRQDDKNFFRQLLADGAEFLSPVDVKKLWSVVRRSLPKFQNRRIGYRPYDLACLEEDSAQHFQQLEFGEDVSADRLLSRCLQGQAEAAHLDLPSSIPLTSLPSLCEVEDALRATQTDRATGFDAVPSSLYHRHAAFLGKYFYQVLLKMFAWGTEPLQNKGGAQNDTQKTGCGGSKALQRHTATAHSSKEDACHD
eukprot:s5733_g2.t1